MDQNLSSRILKTVAFFKERSVSSLPVRPGPKNTLRPCNRCFKVTNNDPINDRNKEIPDFFDNLKLRRSDLPLDDYRSVQYHPGQFGVVRQFQRDNDRQVIFVVGLGSHEDYPYVQAAADQCEVKLPAILETAEEAKDAIQSGQAITLLLRLSLLSTQNDDEQPKYDSLIDSPTLWEILNCINSGKLSYENEYNSIIVPIVLTKDYRLGSVCIQVNNPLELDSYEPSYLAGYTTSVLVKHIKNSLISNAILLPTHLVAYLILNLEREYGPTFKELVDYTDWLMKKQLVFELCLGFSGKAENVVKFGLMALGDSVGKSRFSGCYQPKDIHLVSRLSQLVASHVVYYGFVAKSMLIEHNKSIKNKSQQVVYFYPGMELKIVKDNLVKTCEKLCEPYDKFLRPSCKSLEDHIETLLSDMGTFGKYLKVHEPKVKPRKYCAWAGELEESDEEYFEINRDNPDFKCSISLTTREHRLDRLNLFINSATNLCDQLVYDL